MRWVVERSLAWFNRCRRLAKGVMVRRLMVMTRGGMVVTGCRVMMLMGRMSR
jgi:hypothetical protein